jgi:hypothetical protein
MAQSHIDLVQIVERAFEEIPAALDAGAKVPCIQPRRADLIPSLLGDDPEAIANALLTSLREGTKPADLAGLVVYAAALRLAQFPTSKRIRRLGYRASWFHLRQRGA